jgi:hypothetical protein
MCQLWLDDFAHTFAASFTMLVLDNGAFHTAKTLRWPPSTQVEVADAEIGPVGQYESLA